jgi:hypothetical protein
VTLPKAIQAAKNAAKTLSAKRDAARVAAQKSTPRALIQRVQAGKARRTAPQQLRAEQGKRVKVVESRKAPSKTVDKSPRPQRMRIASRD